MIIAPWPLATSLNWGNDSKPTFDLHLGDQRYIVNENYGPLFRYIKVWVAHAPGMHERFPCLCGLAISTCTTARASRTWCMAGSLTSGFLWIQWRGKCSRYSRRMHNPQLHVSGKRPIALIIHLFPNTWRVVCTAIDCQITSEICWNTAFELQVATPVQLRIVVFFDRSGIDRAAYKSYWISAGGRLNPVPKEKGLNLGGMMVHLCLMGTVRPLSTALFWRFIKHASVCLILVSKRNI